jgi:hypothetical protein
VCAEHLHDEKRATAFSERALKLQRELLAELPKVRSNSPVAGDETSWTAAWASPRNTGEFEAVASALEVQLELGGPAQTSDLDPPPGALPFGDRDAEPGPPEFLAEEENEPPAPKTREPETIDQVDLAVALFREVARPGPEGASPPRAGNASSAGNAPVRRDDRAAQARGWTRPSPSRPVEPAPEENTPPMAFPPESDRAAEPGARHPVDAGPPPIQDPWPVTPDEEFTDSSPTPVPVPSAPRSSEVVLAPAPRVDTSILTPTDTPASSAEVGGRLPEISPDARPTVEVPLLEDSNGSNEDRRKELIERIRDYPLEADAYRDLGDHFRQTSDHKRSALMLEVADALDGRSDAAASPKLILTAEDRRWLRHPFLRGGAAELISLVGPGFIRLFPTSGREAGSAVEFQLTSGKGAAVVTEALMVAVRTLGVGLPPDVYVSNDAGPPLALVNTAEPRLLVGKQAIKRAVPAAEARFFAGRAVFTAEPDVLALRCLTREQLAEAFESIVRASGASGRLAQGRIIRDVIGELRWERVRTLYRQLSSKLNVDQLIAGGRHTVNRAGLVVCGGLAPALKAMRSKKALESEVLELVRFAASERYVRLRGRTLVR